MVDVVVHESCYEYHVDRQGLYHHIPHSIYGVPESGGEVYHGFDLSGMATGVPELGGRRTLGYIPLPVAREVRLADQGVPRTRVHCDDLGR